jgi:hypothetical protein
MPPSVMINITQCMMHEIYVFLLLMMAAEKKYLGITGTERKSTSKKTYLMYRWR